jgi:hypothetical protein
MSNSTLRLTAAVVANLFVATSAMAQTPVAPVAAKHAPATSAATTSAQTPSKTYSIDEVENWTKKQWRDAKKVWAKDETKWADCRGQSSRQKLEGRKNWSFLYTCMAS